jgi:hypothetical protein
MFGEKNGVFLKIQCYDQNFCTILLCFVSKTPIFWEKIFLKIMASVPNESQRTIRGQCSEIKNSFAQILANKLVIFSEPQIAIAIK